ncbi:Transmembrane amino acid transporter protein [Seminavis robusta]|uniref:Transmembrane amino acid transporter protein n=1 Tax=Seminavis robusta TaxID=568900 RepID=A0A9N8EIR0_9STRA|nr:Transmembrane amino acid transporter protein [Seminavis robusta]|eukprot:Sro1238_g255220.1 Transmembrane amino acid transporter protein (650) ;mRNA; f:10746-12771
MDWTSVFEEDGDEAFLISQQLMAIPQAPRLARLVSKLYHHQHSDDDEEEHVHRVSHDDGNFIDEDISEHRLFHLSSRSSNGNILEAENTTTSTSSAYNLRVLYYLSINYILGVGCLGVPYAFARAGFLLCISILSIVTLSSYMTVMWVAESGERYHSLQQQRQQLQHVSADETSHKGNSRTASETSPLVPGNGNNNNHDHHHHHHHQSWDRYEVVDLVGFFLGPIHKILYQASLMALMYIGLLAYSQVFCSAIAELFLWGPSSGRQSIAGLPQLIFGLMVVPLSCVELDEQISLQSIMAAVRFLAIFIMVFGSLLALFLDNSNTTDPEDDGSGPPYWAPPEREGCQMSYTACVSGFGVAFSTSLFSQLFQHSVPGLLRPLRDQPSKHSKVPRTFGASLLTTLSFYLLLGISAASFFGANTRSSVNLNFANFTMGLDAETAPLWLLLVVRTAASVVVIFPALDTISVFPLIANTLGNNLSAAAVGPATIRWVADMLQKQQSVWQRIVTRQPFTAETASHPQTSNRVSFSQGSPEERKVLIGRSSRLITIFWRLVAALPPLLGSIVAADLSFSLLLAGVAGVYVAFFAPSLMQLKSVFQARADDTAGTGSQTIFQGWYSSTFLCYPVLVFATFSLLAVLLQIKGAWLEMQH